MIWKQYKEEKHEDVLASMLEYMADCQADGETLGYTKADVERCNEILDAYIDELSVLAENPDSEEILLAVEKVVVALNELNDECAYSLIETDQREMICDFIIRAAQEAGLESDEMEDITEPWREF